MLIETTTPSANGTFFVITREEKDAPPHRRPLDPGHYEDGVWIDTDLTNEPDEVRAAAQAAWTPDVIAAYQAAFPWVESPPKPFADLSRPAFLFMASKIGASDPVVLGLIDAMPSATPAEADAKTLAKIVYQNQQTFKRDNALLESLAKAAKIPDASIDAAWRVAEQIKW